MENSTPKSYSSDPALYIYTSLTSGSSHIVTATSRMETILRANRVPFKALDIATDEKARMLWGRRAGKDESGRARKIPGLVQMGMVLGDLVEVEDWNEYGELKQHVTMYYDEFTTPSKSAVPLPNPLATKPPIVQKENIKPTASIATRSPAVAEKPKASEEPKEPVSAQPTSFTLAMRQVGEQAAQIAKEGKKKVDSLVGVGTAELGSTAKGPEVDGVKKDGEKSAAVPAPIKIDAPNTIETTAAMQIPTSTAWKQDVTPISVVQESATNGLTEKFASMQSPTSTAWKPAETTIPATYRGSSIATASDECIKKVEDEQIIPEEDEDDDDDDGDSN
ncbi:hypothetical protein BJ878DRAFT_223804 [Calycina marina]|uniref:Thioredoxin-like fold protein n=1 Tax=Calycina marina TaxID=1763456 RepID=A0A9P7YXA8_9HELO|nr:hypothetical protein BJ878DRAFT_223804 [Calycina marina]